MSPNDRQPLLPTHSNSQSHVNNNPTHRLSTTKISFPSSSTSALNKPDTDDSTLIGSSSTSSLPKSRGNTEHGGWTYQDEVDGGRRQGLPKLSRECLWSEIKCYGSYIVPTFLVFGVLVIGCSLLGVGLKKGWFKHD